MEKNWGDTPSATLTNKITMCNSSIKFCELKS